MDALHRMESSQSLVNAFIRACNGRGWRRVLVWLADAAMDAETAQDLLAEAVEGAFIATIQGRRLDSETLVVLDQADEVALHRAIVRRLPRLMPTDSDNLARTLVQELRHKLSGGARLLIDGATVRYVEDSWVAEILRQPARQPSPLPLS